MNYTDIVNRQEALAKEMEKLNEEMQTLQHSRIECAKDHENFSVDQTLTSGLEIQIDLNYSTGDRDIFLLTKTGDDTGMSFGVEDYNEFSQFFSKYNDAILSYMTEITKDDADEAVEA